MFEGDGSNVITGFDTNKEINPILLLLKKLAPRNMGGRNLITVINKFIRPVKVHIVLFEIFFKLIKALLTFSL